MHCPQRFYEARRIDLVAFPFIVNVATNDSGYGVVGSLTTDELFDVGFLGGEETVAKFAVGGEPDPVTVPAEWPGDRCDDADATAAVGIFKFHRGGSGVVIFSRDERRHVVFDLFENFVSEVDLVSFPLIGSDGHVFDEPHFELVFTSELRERNDFVFGNPSHGDGIDFHRIETSGFGSENAFDRWVQGIPSCEFAKANRVERIEADVDSPKTGIAQFLGLIGKENAIRRQPHVLDARDSCQHRDELVEVFAHQRFPAGEPDFVNPKRRGDFHEPSDFLERQQLAAFHELHVFGHAVITPQVTTIGHADA